MPLSQVPAGFRTSRALLFTALLALYTALILAFSPAGPYGDEGRYVRFADNLLSGAERYFDAGSNRNLWRRRFCAGCRRQSLARQLGPEGIHVAHVVIDAVVDMPASRAMLPDRPDAFVRDEAFFEEWMGLCVRTLRWEPERILSALPRAEGGARAGFTGRIEEVVRGLEFLEGRGLAEPAVLEFEEGEDTPLIRTVLLSDGMYVPAVAGPEGDPRPSILGAGGDGPYFRVTHPGLEGAANLRIRCVFYDDPAFGARPVPVTLQYTARASNGPEDSARVLRRHPSQAPLSGSGSPAASCAWLRTPCREMTLAVYPDMNRHFLGGYRAPSRALPAWLCPCRAAIPLLPPATRSHYPSAAPAHGTVRCWRPPGSGGVVCRFERCCLSRARCRR